MLRTTAAASAAQASLLHAVRVALDGRDGEQAGQQVAALLIQAAEAAVHGVLRFKSAQLMVCGSGAALEGWGGAPPLAAAAERLQQRLCGQRAALVFGSDCVHLPLLCSPAMLPACLRRRPAAAGRPPAAPARCPPAPPQVGAYEVLGSMRGLEAHHERREELYELLMHGRKGPEFGWRQRQPPGDSPLLPAAQLLADPSTPSGKNWWEGLPAAKWAQPAAESVGKSK